MGSPFKMNPKTPLMKALTGKQGNLPQQLQNAIKAAPESPAKSYGNSPVKKKLDVVDVDIDKATTTNTKQTSGRYKGTPTKVTKQTVKRVVKRPEGERNAADRKLENTRAARQGEGRIGTKTTVEAGSHKSSQTRLAGTANDKNRSGRTKYRTLADGTKVVKEGSVSKIKTRGGKNAGKIKADTKIKVNKKASSAGKEKSPLKKERSSVGASNRALKAASKARQLRKEADDPKSGLNAKSRAKNRKKALKLSTKSKRIHNKGVVREGSSEMRKNYQANKGKSPAKMKGVKALKKK